MAQQRQKLNTIPKVYDPHQAEERIYKFWMDGGFFRAIIDPSREPFVIILPPTNVTGDLHIGHAMVASIEDALIRWHRMRGEPTLWLPGKDHASIATQVMVERELAEEGLDREQMGRERFLERVRDWVSLYGGRITEQHQRLGVSCDWSRERYTMGEGPSNAVRTTFVNLYKKGLIYRGERLTNWCPRCGTVISDLEVDHQEEQGSLWYLRYPYADGDGYVTVATTRLETFLGDTAVAVNPNDERTKGVIGKSVVLPIIGRRIPIVADEAVDTEFGTGSVKVTPAHDPTDFEIGRRHNLEFVTVLNKDATINENGGPFQGQDRFDARQAIVEEFERQGLLEKVEPHTHSVGHCQRCNTIIEPMVTLQWWMKVGSHEDSQSIAGRAYQAVVDGEIEIVPQRFSKVYMNWMENIRDWCISRQLWWGHRIPVWYCSACHRETVSMEDPTTCEACGSGDIEQDPDVLDTWFSSALWPHSTMGWPEDTEDLAYFYPNSVLETGYDILFFWVARMIMMGLQNTGQIPFRKVYLHGMIRDERGSKMSKTKGNVVNPLELIDQYGADAVRFALTNGITPGNDSRTGARKLEASRNFANKLWNISRYVLQAVDQAADFGPSLPVDLSLEDRWVLSRLDRTVAKVNELLEDFQLGEAQRECHDFLWNEYADWYIEMTKVRLREGGRLSPLPVLIHVLESTLRLLHPFMPFVTEEIWQSLVQRLPDDPSRPPSIMVSPFPISDGSRHDGQAEEEMDLLIDIVTAIRNARSELKVEAGRKVEAIIDAGERKPLVETYIQQVSALAKAHPITVYGNGQPAPTPDRARVAVLGSARVILPVAGVVDLGAERQRIDAERVELEEVLQKLEARLGNGDFVSKAPPAVVEKERARLSEYQARLEKLKERLAEIG